MESIVTLKSSFIRGQVDLCSLDQSISSIQSHIFLEDFILYIMFYYVYVLASKEHRKAYILLQVVGLQMVYQSWGPHNSVNIWVKESLFCFIWYLGHGLEWKFY